jgi:membrane protein DedA with SNARE-associated domain
MEHLAVLYKSYGYWFIFLAVLSDGLGAPPVAMPILLIAGGLAAAGKMSLGLLVLAASSAAAIGDLLWYVVGRSGSSTVSKILNRACANRKVSLARCLAWVSNYSLLFLLVSKFIPGIATLAPPAAGMAKIPLVKFLPANLVSRVLWAASVSWMGYFWQ